MVKPAHPDSMKRKNLQRAVNAYKPDKRVAVAVTCSPEADEMEQPDLGIISNGAPREQVRTALALAWAYFSVPTDAPDELKAPLYWTNRAKDLIIMAHNQLAREMQNYGVDPSVAHLLMCSNVIECAMTMTPHPEFADFLEMYASEADGDPYKEERKMRIVRALHDATIAFMEQPEAAHDLNNVEAKGRA